MEVAGLLIAVAILLAAIAAQLPERCDACGAALVDRELSLRSPFTGELEVHVYRSCPFANLSARHTSRAS